MKFVALFLVVAFTASHAMAATVDAKKGQSAFLCATSLKVGQSGMKNEFLIDSLNDKIISGIQDGLIVGSQPSMNGPNKAVNFGKEFTVSPQIQIHGMYACVLITK